MKVVAIVPASRTVEVAVFDTDKYHSALERLPDPARALSSLIYTRDHAPISHQPEQEQLYAAHVFASTIVEASLPSVVYVDGRSTDEAGFDSMLVGATLGGLVAGFTRINVDPSIVVLKLTRSPARLAERRDVIERAAAAIGNATARRSDGALFAERAVFLGIHAITSIEKHIGLIESADPQPLPRMLRKELVRG